MLSTQIRALFKCNRYEIMHLLNRRGTKIDVQWEMKPGASLLDVQTEMRQINHNKYLTYLHQAKENRLATVAHPRRVNA